MHAGKENRIDSHFILNCLMKALDLVEKDWREQPNVPGALVITGKKSQAKFFSNGKTPSTPCPVRITELALISTRICHSPT